MTLFRQALMQQLQLAGCEFISSGRAGMTLVLSILQKLCGDSQRDEVVIPGYTCYSVPSSIEKAGLRIRVCDIDPVSLSYDLDTLKGYDFSRVLAIVSANLYGLPNDLLSLESLASEHGVFLLDDAAQAFGASIAGRSVGAFGDVGLYSLDKGKNITALQGGILVTKSRQIADQLAEAVYELPSTPSTTVMSYVLKLFIYAALLHPKRYGLVRKLPFLGLGKTPYTTQYPLTNFSPILAAMAYQLYQRMSQITEARRRNGLAFRNALSGVSGISLIEPVNNAEPVYLRFPFLVDDPDIRISLLQELDALGIGATFSYPKAVVDIPELQGRLSENRDTPNARCVASRIITLPTHSYMTLDHVQLVRDRLNTLLS